MQRGEVWWARLPQPQGLRPVLLLSRQRAIQVRSVIIAAPLTRTVRGIPSEVPLGPSDGLPKPCVVNLDSLDTVRKSSLLERITALGPEKMAAVEEAVRFALGLD